MRWERGQRSENIEDRRGQRGRRGPFGGGGARIGLPRSGGGRMGFGGLLILLVLSFVFKENFFALLGGGMPQVQVPQGQVGAPPSVQGTPQEEELVDFVSFVLDDVQSTWGQLLPGYRDARLLLFRDAVQSACGFAQAASGPFYCPADQKVYIDLGFYSDLRRRFGAPGDFAQAYVLAHEIGHHIQRLTGIEGKVRDLQRRNPREANALSVRMELQADCLAGVWGHSTHQRGILERGDVEEGLNAAAAIGDDRIQKMSTGRVHPEGFTHGSSEQRVRWFRRGLESGDADTCDTFSAANR